MPARQPVLWAVVMNTERVRIVRDLNLRADPDRSRALPEEIVLASEAQALRDIMADKPGRSFSSTGGGRRSAMEYASDPVAEATRALLREAIARLETERQAGAFGALLVYADPTTLGEWRKLLPPALAATVTHEVAANHLHLSPRDLRQLLLAQPGEGKA